ncbi:MAG: amidohydrolase family protein [Planctomycetota bacterium]
MPKGVGVIMESVIKKMADEKQQLLKKLTFFDANVWLGRPEGFPLAEELKGTELQNALRKHYIAGALISHWRGKIVSAQDGNKTLQGSADYLANDNFVIWTGLPLYPEDIGPLPGVGKPDKKVRGVRLFPRSHNFPLVSWCLGSLCKWLVEHNMPLFIWHLELDWDQIYKLAKQFPSLRIIIETQTQKILYHTRPLFGLMRDCENVSVELSNFAGAGFIEYAVGRFGAERLIFGSFMPVADPLVPMGMVLDADISESDKALIAGGNIKRLIAEVAL